MADTKISALTAAAAAAAANEYAINEAGTSKKVTGAQINTLVRATSPAIPAAGSSGNVLLSNGTDFISAALTTVATSAPASAITAATDTYLSGSGLAVPSLLRVGTRFRWTMSFTKTAAGTVAPIWTFRFGTLGTTGDTARVTLTGIAQSAATDTKTIIWEAIILTTGATGTILVRQTGAVFGSASGAAAGLGFGAITTGSRGVSATFDTTVANSIIGISVNSGTSAAWTYDNIYTEIRT